MEECPIVQSFTSGQGCRVDSEVFWRRDGTSFPVEYSSHPIREDGAITGAVVMFSDSTARKKLEAQLLQSQKMEAIGQLAGGIAHDFNNLLGSIIGNTELANQEAGLPPAAKDCLRAVLKASQRATDLVRQILAFSRRSEQERRPMQLEIVVREALELLRATVPATIGFKTELAKTRTVLADPTQVHQVIMNLCTNAAHAMRARPGVLRVELAEVEVAAEFAKTHADLCPGCYVRLMVADNGCGMNRATVAHVFEPFFTRREGGAGLGLTFVQRVVHEHHGRVAVKSGLGHGTVFRITLPVSEVSR